MTKVTIVTAPSHTNILGGHTVKVRTNDITDNSDDYPYRVDSDEIFVDIHRDDIALLDDEPFKAVRYVVTVVLPGDDPDECRSCIFDTGDAAYHDALTFAADCADRIDHDPRPPGQR